MNQEINDYIVQSRANGASDDLIRQALLNAGHAEATLSEYFVVQPPEGISKKELESVATLFRKAFSFFHQNKSRILLLWLPALTLWIIVSVLKSYAAASVPVHPAFLFTGTVLEIIANIVIFLTFFATSVVVLRGENIPGAFLFVLRRWKSVVWASILVSLIASSIIVLFLVLLAGSFFFPEGVSGISRDVAKYLAYAAIFIFSASAYFSVHFILFSDARGITALSRSRNLFRKRWGNVLFRILIIPTVSAFALSIINVSSGTSFLYPAVSFAAILLVCVALFGSIYFAFLFQNLFETSEEPSPVKRWRYIVSACVGFPVATILTVFVALGLVWSFDDPLLDDSDLRLQKIEIPADLNFYEDLVLAAGKVVDPNQSAGCVDWFQKCDSWNDIAASLAVEQNKEALTLLDQALLKPKYQDPAFADAENINPNTLMAPLNSFRSLSRTNVLFTEYLAHQGKEKEALEQARKGVELGGRMEDSENNLISYLVAMAIKKANLTVMKEVLASSTPEQSTIQEYATWVETLSGGRQGFRSAFLHEYANILWMKEHVLDNWQKGGKVEGSEFLDSLNSVPFVPYYRPNKTQNMFSDFYRKMSHVALLSCEEGKKELERAQEGASAIKRSVGSRGYVFEENVIGKLVFSIQTTALSSVFQKKCDEEALVGDIRRLLSEKASLAHKQSYPR